VGRTVTVARGRVVLGVTLALSAALAGCPQKKVPSPPVMLSECLTPSPPASGDQCTGNDQEPNDSILMAQLTNSNTCDIASVSGAIGFQDVDAFHFTGTLCQKGKPVPPPQLSHDGTDTEQCLFLQCATGATGLASCSGAGYARRLPNGLTGCCLAAAGQTDLAFSCSNTVGNVNGYVLVTGNGGTCANYEVDYHL
jgi:hypothetical protein